MQLHSGPPKATLGAAVLSNQASPRVEKALDRLFQTDFLSRCRSGSITRLELIAFLQQHRWYSRQFTRYLAALVANIPNDDDRRDLMGNLFDEMGLGDAGSVPHTVLYLDMMRHLGLDGDQPPYPATQALAGTMLGCCRSPKFMVGLGALCLGAEAIVPRMYAMIVDGFLALGESRENFKFFTLHMQCDDEHAATMQDIIARELANNPAACHDLLYGAERALLARVRFFEALSVH
ncbi:TenA family transcriptional regulator [Methylolobus aquaticus]